MIRWFCGGSDIRWGERGQRPTLQMLAVGICPLSGLPWLLLVQGPARFVGSRAVCICFVPTALTASRCAADQPNPNQHEFPLGFMLPLVLARWQGAWQDTKGWELSCRPADALEVKRGACCSAASCPSCEGCVGSTGKVLGNIKLRHGCRPYWFNIFKHFKYIKC